MTDQFFKQAYSELTHVYKGSKKAVNGEDFSAIHEAAFEINNTTNPTKKQKKFLIMYKEIFSNKTSSTLAAASFKARPKPHQKEEIIPRTSYCYNIWQMFY